MGEKLSNATGVAKPSIGRIVLFRDGTSDEVPAIVTKVHSDAMVNLTVFADAAAPYGKTSVGHNDNPQGPAGMSWRWPPRV